MKNRTLFYILPVFALAGCGPEKITKPQQTPLPSIQPAIAGVWQTAAMNPWKLTLAEDGTVTEVLRKDGLHFVMVDGSVEYRPLENVYAKYVFGPCLWDYDPVNRRLNVVLTIDDMLVKTGQQEFQCSLIDEFSGTISEDGKTWTPEWIMTQKYQASQDDVFDNGTQTFTKTQ
jgi:hypothetical protein